MNYEELFKKDAFKRINPEILEKIKMLSINIQGKSSNESILYIMDFYNSMPKDINLSKEERDAVMEAIILNLSKEERKNFLKMLDLINNFV